MGALQDAYQYIGNFYILILVLINFTFFSSYFVLIAQNLIPDFSINGIKCHEIKNTGKNRMIFFLNLLFRKLKRKKRIINRNHEKLNETLFITAKST